MLGKLLRAIRSTGASSEDATERDGAFSYHAESHAVGIGVGVGFAAIATEQFKLIGALVTLVVYGRRGETALGADIVEDVRSEKPYTLGGLVVGAAFGLLTRVVLGV
jgi:hypothetical protein